MLNNKENIRIIPVDSVLSILVLFLGLFIYNNSFSNPPERNKNSVTTDITISQNLAVCCSGIQLQFFQKSWICNKDNFRFLSFYMDPVLENRITDHKISLLQNIRNNTVQIPNSIFQYHLFPAEKDELPVLG